MTISLFLFLRNLLSVAIKAKFVLYQLRNYYYYYYTLQEHFYYQSATLNDPLTQQSKLVTGLPPQGIKHRELSVQQQ
jgi:hypothetical protein